MFCCLIVILVLVVGGLILDFKLVFVGDCLLVGMF